LSSRAVAALAVLVVLAHGSPVSPQTAATATPILVELFTSEGCSSCPPADALLQQLVDAQPIAGAQIVALGEHVDYWDQQGWKDRFSSAALTRRQESYANRLNLPSIYTPELVVDGRAELVGSDANAARHAIEKARATTHGIVSLTVDDRAAKALAVAVDVRDLPALGRGDRADVVVAITEEGLRSNVTRGENHGRLLAHAAVVRQLIVIGEAASDRPSLLRAEIPIGADWQRDRVSVVAFVQERRGRAILASAIAGAPQGRR
jgi:hypothetical protein